MVKNQCHGLASSSSILFTVAAERARADWRNAREAVASRVFVRKRPW
jgi:hypothetical protein